jgi:P27 family predicted phage terminase small subunit
MGRRGPAPTPTKLLDARGSWRGSANAEPMPAGKPIPPPWLQGDAKVVWDEMLDQFCSTLGVITTRDRNALARYCDVFVRWRKAADFLEKNGDVFPINDAKGKLKCLQQFPQVAIYRNLALMLLRLEQEFGLTPASRTRIQVIVANAPSGAPPRDNATSGDSPPPLRIAN